MNIDKIIKECPRAWGRWCEFSNEFNEDNADFEDGYITLNPYRTRHRYYFRELYDFFDSVGVYVEVSDPTYEAYWGYEVDGLSRNGYDSRTEAEYRAFEKAFEIYEKQLGDKE